MSNENKILDYLKVSDGRREDAEDVYAEGSEYRAFGISRKPISSEPMINFILGTGTQKAVAYSHLYSLDFDPSIGITLEFTEHVVQIKGRSLREGFQKLSSHRVVFVAEADRPTAVLGSVSKLILP